MLDKIIHFSIHNKLMVGLMMLGLISWGSYSLLNLPIDAVPDITNNQVQVITISPSLAATDIERMVTFPVESVLANIPGMTEIRSFSRFGLSVITVVFEDGIDIYWARQQISERITQVVRQLPIGIGSPELAPVTSGLGEIYQYILRPKKGYESKFTAMDLRTLQDWIVRRQLLGTKGVADVSSFGGYLKQYEIAIDPDQLQSMGLNLNDLFVALEKNNQNVGGAYIEKSTTAYYIRSEGLIQNAANIENIVIKQNTKNLPVLIRDVAKVQLGHATRYGAMTYNAEGEVVGGIVLMLKGANSSQVINNVKEKIKEISKSLPEGVMLEAFLDRTKLVNNAIETVSENLLLGALIVIFVLVLFLGNWRAGIIVASVIPLALLFAVSMMNAFGVSGNLMSLGAIDFGLIIDGAVIIVEATIHHLGIRKTIVKLTQLEMDKEVYDSASKIRSSAAFGEIIILIVYLPILALSGVEGKMFSPMAKTVAFAIMGAFILSLTYVPMISALLLSKKIAPHKNLSDKMMDFFHSLYQPVLVFALRFRYVIISISVALLFISLLIFGTLGGEFIPSLDEGDFALEVRLLPGSSLELSVETTKKMSAVLLKNFPEIKRTVAKIGSSEIPVDPMPMESFDLMIILKDKNEWTSAHTKDELATKMSDTLAKYIPGIAIGFQQPIQMRFNELMTGIRQDVAIKIYGEDLGVLADLANKVGKIAGKVKGAQDIFIEQIAGLSQVVITLKREAIARFGLSIEEVNRSIQTAFAGAVAGKVYEGEKRFDLVLRLNSANRSSIEDIKRVFVSSLDGRRIPLDQIADVELKLSPNQIQRDNTHRRVTVAFNVRGRDVESIVLEMKKLLDKGIRFPVGYYATFGGQFQNLQDARQRLLIAVPISLFMIFVLLYFTFQSVKQSLVIFTAIPLSAIGGILALWLRGMSFSISAGVGFIALFGVAVLNGIVLIAEFNFLKKEGLTNLYEIIYQGTATRLRPVLMTASVASLGFFPMAFSNGSGAEVQKPLATVVIGGLLSATLLTLLVLPCLYFLTEKGVKVKPKKVAAVLILGFLWMAQSVFAQDRVNLEQAIELAKKNNLTLQFIAGQPAYFNALRPTAGEVGKTSLTWQAGQYNSISFDNAFTISQGIPFPTIFKKKADLIESQFQSSQIQTKVFENELILSVKNTYTQLQFLNSQKILLNQQDSLYKEILKMIEVRVRTGESNSIEEHNATARLSEIQVALHQNHYDADAFNIELQTLINGDTKISMVDSLLTKPILKLPSDTNVSYFPLLQLLQQQITIQEKQILVEKANRLPDIALGYFNQSLTGTQLLRGQDRFFDGNYRFQGFILGLAFPIFSKPYRARIEATQVKQQLAEKELQAQERTITGALKTTIQMVLKYQESLNIYENQTLPATELFLKKVRKALQSQEINYLELAPTIQSTLAIKQNYLNNLYQYCLSIHKLEFLLANQE